MSEKKNEDGREPPEGRPADAPGDGRSPEERPAEKAAPRGDFPIWEEAQEFPRPSAGREDKGQRTGERENRKLPSPEVPPENWRNNRDTRAPREKGMSRDGQRLGYGRSHAYERVEASASQGANFGEVGGDLHQHFHGVGGERTPPTGHYTEEDLKPTAERYTKTGTEERIGELLETEHVVVLRGQARTGRRTTALHCLYSQLGGLTTGKDPRVTLLTPDENLDSVAAQAEERDNGPCFLLDATGASWARAITESRFRAAFGAFAVSDQRLIVLVDEPAPAEPLHGLLVDHQTPDLRELVANHLTCLLPRREGKTTEERALKVLKRAEDETSPVSSWLEAMWYPAEGVLLATALHLWDQGEVPSLADEVSDQRRRWLERRARELLVVTDPERAPGDQAYALAGAVLSEHPSAVIGEAAEHLVRVLGGTDSRFDGAAHFTEPLERRFRHMRVAGQSEKGTALALSQPELGPALLHVVWHEYSRSQKAVVTWLAQLCESEEYGLGVVAASAQALAQLAGYARDTVLGRTVDKWGRWDEDEDLPQQCLWAAAWLLEKLVFNQSPTPDALDEEDADDDDPRHLMLEHLAWKLRAWARPEELEASYADESFKTHYPRWMIAMITYGTYAALVPPLREDAAVAFGNAARLSIRTRQFARITPDSGFAGFLRTLSDQYALVLEVTATDVYRVGARGPVIRELVRWSEERSPDLLLLACRTMLSIAEVRGDGSTSVASGTPVDGDDRPFDLLLWLSSGGDGLPLSARDQVRKLWIVALSHPATRKKSWSQLFRWDLQAESPITLGQANYVGYSEEPPAAVSPMRDYLTGLFAEIYTSPQLKSLHPRLDKYHHLRGRIAPDKFPSEQGGPR